MIAPVDEDISQLSFEIWQSAAALPLDTEVVAAAGTAEIGRPSGRGPPPGVAGVGATPAADASQDPQTSAI